MPCHNLASCFGHSLYVTCVIHNVFPSNLISTFRVRNIVFLHSYALAIHQQLNLFGIGVGYNAQFLTLGTIPVVGHAVYAHQLAIPHQVALSLLDADVHHRFIGAYTLE